MKKRVVHYVNNRTLLIELTKYYDDKMAGKDPRISEYIGECIMLIVENMSKRPNFRDYTYLAEMKGDAIERSVSSIKSFDPNRSSNPFGWLSRTIWNAFIKRILDEKREHAIKHKNQLRHHLFDSSFEVNDVSDGVVASYDKILADRKLPKPKKEK